eukprot:scaffold41187_cov43-Attheya_sp.AAC.4
MEASPMMIGPLLILSSVFGILQREDLCSHVPISTHHVQSHEAFFPFQVSTHAAQEDSGWSTATGVHLFTLRLLCGSSESRQSTKEVMGPESRGPGMELYGQSGTMTTDTRTLPYATLSMPYIAPAMTLKATPMMIIGGTDCHGMISFGMRCSSLSLCLSLL